MYLKERVVENRLIGHPAQGIYKLVLSGQAAQAAQPGQFVHIQAAETNDPLLRRPLSIAGIDKNKEEITIYYRVAGRGTDLLTRIKADEYASILGPLGTSFTVPREGKLLLIGGGIGIFPLYSLLQAMEPRKEDIKLLWGGESKTFLESSDLNHLQRSGVDYEIATMDGSLGQRGLITDLLNKYLEDAYGNKSNVKEYSRELKKDTMLRAAVCGPRGMLKAVTEICLRKGIPVEVSMEERMACGVGACLGCVCTVRDDRGNLQRKRVCKEGPVFNGKEVVWDAEI